MGRFKLTTDEERVEKRLGMHSNKTLKANKSAAKILKEYLTEIGQNCQFESLEEGDLDGVLGRFWMDLRKTDGNAYKVNSVEGIRHGINRYFKNPPYNKT
jgi:hypothetical protein